jgi:antitoxin component YwqK of YwqJK toxin-antitoxin module
LGVNQNYSDMRILLMAVLITLVSCSKQPPPADTTIQDNPSKEGVIPPGGAREEFADTPGLVRVTFTDNGVTKTADGTYLNGKKQGTWSEYHPNGLLKNLTTYINGEKEGISVELNNNGQLTKRCYYHKGVRHGEYKEFNYANLKEERVYSYGKIEGQVKIYYDNTKLMEESLYKNGVRDGVSKWFDQEGNLTIEYEYKNGELIKK